MRKFKNLIVNEYIKVFYKASTIIMLILIVGLAVLWNMISMIIQKDQNNNTYSDQDAPAIFEQNIKTAKEFKEDGWEMDVEKWEFMQQEKISLQGDWRYGASEEIFSIKYFATGETNPVQKAALQQQVENQLESVQKDDWKQYLLLKKESYQSDNTLSSKQKEVTIEEIDYRLQHDLQPVFYTWIDPNIDWRDRLYRELTQTKVGVIAEEEQGISPPIRLQQKILMDEYRLNNNIQFYTQNVSEGNDLENLMDQGFWWAFTSSVSLLSIISLLIIIVAGGSIASEYSTGTIKFLLINPVSRWKILVAKYVSILTLALVMLSLFYFLNMIIAGMFFGFEAMGAPHLYVVGDQVKESSSLLFVAQQYLLDSVNLLLMATFSFALSCLVRNAAFAIGLSVFLLLTGNTVVTLLSRAFYVDFGRYFIFSNTNLYEIYRQTPLFYGQTIWFAIGVLAVYMFIFWMTAWDAFVRRDVQ